MDAGPLQGSPECTSSHLDLSPAAASVTMETTDVVLDIGLGLEKPVLRPLFKGLGHVSLSLRHFTRSFLALGLGMLWIIDQEEWSRLRQHCTDGP